MCKDRIEKAAVAVEGVETAEWDKENQTVKITHKEGVDLHSVHDAIAAVGHEAERHKPPEDVYNALPGCCKYKEVEKH